MESELERIERRRHRLLVEPCPKDSRAGWLRRAKKFHRDPSHLELNAKASDCVLMEDAAAGRALVFSTDRNRILIRKQPPPSRGERLNRLAKSIAASCRGEFHRLDRVRAGGLMNLVDRLRLSPLR